MHIYNAGKHFNLPNNGLSIGRVAAEIAETGPVPSVYTESRSKMYVVSGDSFEKVYWA